MTGKFAPSLSQIKPTSIFWKHNFSDAIAVIFGANDKRAALECFSVCRHSCDQSSIPSSIPDQTVVFYSGQILTPPGGSP